MRPPARPRTNDGADGPPMGRPYGAAGAPACPFYCLVGTYAPGFDFCVGPWSDTGSPATTASRQLSCNAPAVCPDRQGLFFARYIGLQENDLDGVAFQYPLVE
jgi:hypothetical protein